MSSSSRKYGIILLLAVIAMLSACSVNNKNIPDPGGNIGVDTTGTAGTFYLNVSGDSSYLLTIVAADTIVSDSFIVAGGDLTRKDEIVFATKKAEVGTYYTEQSPPGITTAICLFRKKTLSGYKNYAMLHGTIIITSVDLTSKILRGSIDVNNQYVSSADLLIRLRGNFSMKLNI